MNNVTPIERPHCSLCHKTRLNNELNGYDPLAPVGGKYINAYCRELTQCDSVEAKEQLSLVIEQLDK